MAGGAVAPGLTLAILDAPEARHALNALAGALERSPAWPALELRWAREPEALGAACAAAAAAGRPALGLWSFLSAAFPAAIAALRRARAAGGGGALHLAGGAHASASAAEVLEAGFDLAATGEGEPALALLCERLLRGEPAAGPGLAWAERGKVVRGARAPGAVLDDLPPFPSDCSRGGAIEISRGCVHACRFCQTSYASGGRPRHRSPEVVARWAGAQAAAGRPDVRFVSPSALAYGSEDGNPRLDRVEALLRAVRAALGPGGRIFLGTFPSEVRPDHVTPEALRLLAGLVDNRALVLGAQSGSDGLLDRAHRGHRAEDVDRAVALAVEAGFEPQVDFILGMPGETAEDAAATRRQMERLAARGATIRGHAFLPLPGTPWQGAEPGAADPETARLLDRLASQGRSLGQWRRQEALGRRLADGRGPPGGAPSK